VGLTSSQDFRKQRAVRDGKLWRMQRQPFDFTSAMERLCGDIVAHTPELGHVRMPQVAISFAQARRRVLHGLQAKLTPLRFEAGSLILRRGRSEWTIRRLFRGDVEILYILTFYLPRFLDQSLEEKFVTVFHELFHIGPRFDGDIRRHEGRYHVHSASQKAYDREMARLAQAYLRRRPRRELWGFLELSFDELLARHGSVIGRRIPVPKLIRLPASRSA
jgi:hypothetical protein